MSATDDPGAAQRVAAATEAALDAIDGRPADRWLDDPAGRRAITVVRAIQAARETRGAR